MQRGVNSVEPYLQCQLLFSAVHTQVSKVIVGRSWHVQASADWQRLGVDGRWHKKQAGFQAFRRVMCIDRCGCLSCVARQWRVVIMGRCAASHEQEWWTQCLSHLSLYLLLLLQHLLRNCWAAQFEQSPQGVELGGLERSMRWLPCGVDARARVTKITRPIM